jgi:hypothetical protein
MTTFFPEFIITLPSNPELATRTTEEVLSQMSLKRILSDDDDTSEESSPKRVRLNLAPRVRFIPSRKHITRESTKVVTVVTNLVHKMSSTKSEIKAFVAPNHDCATRVTLVHVAYLSKTFYRYEVKVCEECALKVKGKNNGRYIAISGESF